MPQIDWITNKSKQRVYPYTHADAVIMDDTNKKLATAIDEVNEKIENLNFSQSDWNETNPEQVSYIKNKPESLPASGGDSDTLEGKHANEFTLLSDFNTHKSSLDSHKALLDEKLNVEIANTLFKDISFDSETGVITITRLNNTITTIDLPVELLLKSGKFDNGTKEIVLILKDDSEIRIPATSLVDIYTGKENDVIQILVEDNNVISAIVKSNSITKSLFSIEIQTLLDSLESKSHTHVNESTLNLISDEIISQINASYSHLNDVSKHVPEGGENGQVLTKAEIGYEWASVAVNDGTSDYNELTNKPLINGVELNGDRSLSELGIILSGAEQKDTRLVYEALTEDKVIEGNFTRICFISNDSSTYNIHVTVTYNDDTETGMDIYGFETLNDLNIKFKKIAFSCNEVMRCRYLLETEV